MRALLLLLFASVSLAADLPPLDTNAQTPGYFVASSKNVTRYRDPSFPADRISLVALTASVTTVDGHRGFMVVLANHTRETARFESQDSRLNIVREAVDVDGKWKPIEYLPHSWCGNSYYSVELPAGYSWSFAAPQYGGSFRTRMRFVLKQNGLTLISNEFEGTMRRGQFTREQGPALD